ncbi:MAG: undecaprenyldiphospho-muramoylpentapeptide beta-N-acetylglucosaminyltransferase [Chloracidobacterium sp.]|nr:undecaprenyldiphospho-muramoylpentapeptide beta-N-acetylglucosaminyltransferase [Chloracidobacterium sp.]MDW8217590.1 undecaprenyldiphospho-muramoylpentapeptide beta-N-acetylglucosaminyltransferase [Acidobacteriota bacterium]
MAAGGTGGHIFPGIAIARAFVRRDPTTEVHFVGTERGLEKKLVPEAGFQLTLIPAGALNNVSWGRRLQTLGTMPSGLWKAWRLVRSFKPDIAVGVGGYASGPAMLAAIVHGVPTLAVEVNVLPGLTNRLLAPFVTGAAVSYRETAVYFGAKAVLTGTPVRVEFEQIPPKPSDAPRGRVLVFGGSQGAQAINRAMADAAPHLAVRPGLSIVHQTGERDVELVRAAYAAAGLQAEVLPFIHHMAEAMAAADVLVCRAGAATIAEIAAAGRAAIFIPFPQAADDHQRKNAEAFAQAGAGEVILQADLTGAKLAQTILNLLDDPKRLARMEAAARALAVPRAAERTVDVAYQILRRAR